VTRSRSADDAAARPQSRNRLDLEEVARAALDLADREGLDAVSMRRLANEVGVGTMTLYVHFRSKDELLDAMIDAAYAGFQAPPPSDSFRDGIRDVVLAARAVMIRHPAMVEIRGSQPIVTRRALTVTEIGMRVLIDAGFDAQEAAHAFRVLFDYVFGYALVNPRAPSEEVRRTAHSGLVALPPDEFPALTSAAAEIAESVGGDRQFDYGLDRIIDGLEARLATTASVAAPGARRRRTGRPAR
jgi:AcrR family transcriptional regulator